MTIDALLTAGAMLVVAVCCGIAVFSESFHDTLLQRLGLAGVALGAAGIATLALRDGDVPQPLTVLSVSAALFGLETARKVIAKRRSGRWNRD